MSKYFIAVPTDNNIGHMTVRFLGELSSSEVSYWINKMNELTNIEKFPIKSMGMGMLGQHESQIVNFIKKNPRLNKTLGIFDEGRYRPQIPHVIVQRQFYPNPPGPIAPMNTVLADKVNLYEDDGNGWRVVHSVMLQRRSPITWIKDMLGFSKFAESEKLAAIAPYIEAAVGGALGWQVGKAADPNSNTGRLSGGALGAIAAVPIGKRFRNAAEKRYANVYNQAARNQRITQQRAHEVLHNIRKDMHNQGFVTSVPGVGKLQSQNEIFEEGVAPALNTILAGTHQRKALRKLRDQAKSRIADSPFGIGLFTEPFKQKLKTYTVPHHESGLNIKEDVLTSKAQRLGSRQRYILQELRANSDLSPEATQQVINKLKSVYLQHK